ncbi:MAG: epimerase [Anaerolineaceae bacterium]|nr:NAD(P)-dependent oxidoreductase [Anaerolineae bacterium]MBL1173035.1 NAD(P)-dependent oxidoreductase [Chloroflexota bacterium]MDL1926922.1 NAD(P)-dependent oxidoreductase [Anaerolineae bacterium AMX1]WKZ54297.1 MAG: NAD(P)-dependent oxidoreductase [Anaerolineales bacterium]GJQ38060.1 MAG: epimerase [Anaerolineaceae bacterium]
MTRHAVITGGAGYIGSLLTSELLRAGWRVTVLDSLLFGGESLVPFLSHPNFHFVKADVTDPRAVKDSLKGDWQRPEAVIHLAAIVGFPACQAVGKQAAWKYNVEATKMVFEQSSALGAERFVFASSYSNYGLSPDGKPVTEESPLNPQSLYAETKIAAEEYLLGQKDAPAAPLLFRFATLYGISPRTRFDLIVNQFVLEAFTKRELIIYQRGYSRSFVHVRDTVRGILLGLDAPEAKTRGQVYNLGADNGNYTKDQIVNLVLVRMPETVVEYKNLTFGGDMRDITVSFEKIHRELRFETALTVDDGIRELVFALKSGLIRNPHDEKYRNAQFIVQ